MQTKPRKGNFPNGAMLSFAVYLHHPAYVERYLPKGVQVGTNHVGYEPEPVHLNQSRITFLCVPYGKVQVLVRLRHKREVPAVVIINEIFLVRLGYIRVKHILSFAVFQEVAVGGDALLDFPVFLFLRTLYYLVEVHLLYGQIEGVLFRWCFHVIQP